MLGAGTVHLSIGVCVHAHVHARMHVQHACARKFACAPVWFMQGLGEHIVMAYVVMAYIVMGYIVMAYVVMAYVAMA